jgi:hypothetical protein
MALLFVVVNADIENIKKKIILQKSFYAKSIVEIKEG